MKRIIIAGTNSGCGKTTVTMGLLAALSEKMNVQAYKVGPDYIDTAFHTYITKREASNLDSWMLNEDDIKTIFLKNSIDADISIIEGVMGLYDGFGTDINCGSTASVAKILNSPVIIVVDGKSIASSIAAIVKGFVELDPDVNLAGVIINNIMGVNHYNLLKNSIEKYTNVKVLGYLSYNNNLSIPSRHLGLIPNYELEDLNIKISSLRKEVEKTIDLDYIVSLSDCNDFSIENKKPPIGIEKPIKVKIGIAKDEAFNFYYKDSLDLLKEYGVELIEFSPIHDNQLPDNLDALYIGGGFPEIFADKLSKNSSFKDSILQLLSEGIPYYAECGGLMYLCNKLIDFKNNSYPMVGWFDFNCVMTSKLQRFGYEEITLSEDSILGMKGNKIRAHEFHRSVVTENSYRKLFNIEKKQLYKVRSWECGFIKGNGLAGYPHLHFYSNKDFAANFIKAAKKFKERNELHN